MNEQEHILQARGSRTTAEEASATPRLVNGHAGEASSPGLPQQQHQQQQHPLGIPAPPINLEGSAWIDENHSHRQHHHSSRSIVHQRDVNEIWFPRASEEVEHIALDIGGSLAKVVYFTHEAIPSRSQYAESRQNGSLHEGQSSTSGRAAEYGELALTSKHTSPKKRLMLARERPRFPGRRPSIPDTYPGGRLNFVKFETDKMDECVKFVHELLRRRQKARDKRLQREDQSNGVDGPSHSPIRIIATGGGAHKFHDRFLKDLGINIGREDEMECLIDGLNLLINIPEEVFIWDIEQKEGKQNAGMHPSELLSRDFNPMGAAIYPSPTPSANDGQEGAPTFPYLLVNIGSGVSMIKVEGYEKGQFQRISGTSLGGGTLWGLLSVLTGAKTFDEMLEMALKGDNKSVDMLVQDIYGSDYGKIGLKGTTIASTFGKVFQKRKGKSNMGSIKPEDMSRSLLYAVSNNIGQIAYLNAEMHHIDRVYFAGAFIRDHAVTVTTLSYAIKFWSKNTKRAFFLRHAAYLGAIGAFLRSVEMDREGSEASHVDSL